MHKLTLAVVIFIRRGEFFSYHQVSGIHPRYVYTRSLHYTSCAGGCPHILFDHLRLGGGFSRAVYVRAYAGCSSRGGHLYVLGCGDAYSHSLELYLASCCGGFASRSAIYIHSLFGGYAYRSEHLACGHDCRGLFCSHPRRGGLRAHSQGASTGLSYSPVLELSVCQGAPSRHIVQHHRHHNPHSHKWIVNIRLTSKRQEYKR